MNQLPSGMNYNRDIVNEGSVEGRGCCRAVIISNRPRVDRTDTAFPIIKYLKKEYDLYNQLSLYDGVFYPNKKDQTKRCMLLVEHEIHVQAMAGQSIHIVESEDLFNINFTAYEDERVPVSGPAFQSKIDSMGTYIPFPPTHRRFYSDHFLTYGKRLVELDPNGKLRIDIDFGVAQTLRCPTLDILEFNLAITDISVEDT